LSENHDPGRRGGPRAHHEQEATEASAGQGETALGFRQAMEELEGILERIEGEEIDIDQLAQELRRAAQLLDLCRGKIRKAEVEVTQIVQSLTASSESSESGESAASGENSGEPGAGDPDDESSGNGERSDPRGRGGS
jgi:exodeoxyribonuclease VII small subunit